MAFIEALEPLPASSPNSPPTSPPAVLFQTTPPPPAVVPDPPVAAPPPENASQAATPSAAEQTFKQILENWRQVLSVARQYSPATQGLLNSCKPMGVKDGVLYLSFSSPIMIQKMEAGNNIENTRKALAQVLGTEMPVRCFVASSSSGSLPPDVEGDGMVAAALRDLGGEVVDIQ